MRNLCVSLVFYFVNGKLRGHPFEPHNRKMGHGKIDPIMAVVVIGWAVHDLAHVRKYNNC